MAQARHQQQQQGHHQLAPLLPPAALLPLLARAERLPVVAIAQAGREAQTRQGLEQRSTGLGPGLISPG